MTDKNNLIMEQSIRLELSISDLYMIFYNSFPEDSDFWWKLVIEERNHAALIKSIQSIFQEISHAPDGMFACSEDAIRDSISLVEKLTVKFGEEKPSRSEAFDSALLLEMSAGEIHFQVFTTGNDHSDVKRVFKELNGADRDHAERIRDYMTANGIPFA